MILLVSVFKFDTFNDLEKIVNRTEKGEVDVKAAEEKDHQKGIERR